MVEPRDTGLAPAAENPIDASLTAAFFRATFTGPLLSAGGHDGASGNEYVESGKADAVVYGRQ